MLVNFKISNFMSFNDIQGLSMVGGKVRGKREHLSVKKGQNLLRFAAIYGANASGKSNLISGLDFAEQTITKGIPKGYTNRYNRTSLENKNTPSHFEFELKLNNKNYCYGFEIIINQSSIVGEWLSELVPNGNPIEIFKRDLIKKEFVIGKYFKDLKVRERLTIYFDDIKSLDSVLFLSEMNHNKSELYQKSYEISIFNIIYNWFKYSLDINYPDKPLSNYSYFMRKTEEVCQDIKLFGAGITDFNIIDAKQEELANMIPKNILKDVYDQMEKEIIKTKKENKNLSNMGVLLRGEKEFYLFNVDEDFQIKAKTIEFSHGDHGNFNISEESDGTRRILELIEILFSENNNKTYVIDEIDRSLHPLLTTKFIQTYLDALGKKNVQLIVTTHESRLLDLDILRRDEIWFVNKNINGNSDLYSLEQYSERFDKKIDNAYLQGRYGAVPLFDEV